MKFYYGPAELRGSHQFLLASCFILKGHFLSPSLLLLLPPSSSPCSSSSCVSFSHSSYSLKYYCATQKSLELTMSPRLVSNSWISCPCNPVLGLYMYTVLVPYCQWDSFIPFIKISRLTQSAVCPGIWLTSR